MNNKPILFSTDMVKAKLEGRKTMTRRTKGLELYNERSGDASWLLESTSTDPALIVGSYANGDYRVRGAEGFYAHFRWSGPGDVWKSVKCPYGQIGDILWVRETYCWPEFLGPEDRGYIYKASDNGEAWEKSDAEWKWRPSIHMPKSACRLFLEITDIRVERLTDITEEDAIAEGVQQITEGDMGYRSYAVADGGKGVYPYVSFKTLWQKINGAGSWGANPWVWAITFKRIDKPENFK